MRFSKLAGTGAALAMLIGGVTAAILGMLYAEVGAAFPGAGGIYPSLSRLLGRMATFPYIVLLTPIAFAQVGFTALGLADYARVLAPGVPYMPLVFGSIAAATVVALLNIRFGAWVTAIFLAVETVALTILTIVAVSHPARSLGVVLTHAGLPRSRRDAADAGSDHGAGRGRGGVDLRRRGLGDVFRRGDARGAAQDRPRDRLDRLPRRPDHRGSDDPDGREFPQPAFDPGRGGADGRPTCSQTGGPTIAAVVSAGVAAAIFNSMIATIMAYGRYLYATGRDGIWPRPVSRDDGRLCTLASSHLSPPP